MEVAVSSTGCACRHVCPSVLSPLDFLFEEILEALSAESPVPRHVPIAPVAEDQP